jgi:Putative beta barrel porin-7 (BBP7)
MKSDAVPVLDLVDNFVISDGHCSYHPSKMTMCTTQYFWGQGEYLMYWTKAADLPVLASTGVLGQPGVASLIGGNATDLGLHSGTRITLGVWECSCQELGFQGSYFLLGNTARNFNTDNSANPTLAQPFANAVTGQEDAAFLAVPTSQNGSIHVRLSNQMEMADVLARINLAKSQVERFDFLLGYHYAQFSERLNIDASTTYIDPLGVNRVGTVIASNDFFQGKNYFHGGEFGLVSKSTTGRLSVELSTRLSLGSTASQVRVDGNTITAVPTTATQNSVGGLLALPTNINTYTHNSFAFIPQVGVTLIHRVTKNADCSFGYSFIYWSKVARPGEQIDRKINPTQIPPGPLVGVIAPQFTFATTDFWVQGIQFGLNYRF